MTSSKKGDPDSCSPSRRALKRPVCFTITAWIDEISKYLDGALLDFRLSPFWNLNER